MSDPGKYRVLNVSSASDWRGGEQQVAYLLQELVSSGVDSVLLCPQNSALHRYCISKGLPHKSFVRKLSTDLSLAIQIFKLCRREKFDIVHTHDGKAHAAAWIASLLGNKVPLVISRRVDFPVRSNWISDKKYNCSSIRAYLCVSNAVKLALAPAVRSKELLKVVHDGIDVDRFKSRSKRVDLRELCEIPADHKIVGNVAAMADHKDLQTFLRTAAILRERSPNVHFVLIGEGPERESLENLIDSLDLRSSVHLLGFKDDVPDLLPQFDTFLFTSKMEGLGTAILDAFACGVPVVATRAGGIPEVIEHDVNGLLAPVKDAETLAGLTEKVIADPSLRDQLVTGANATLVSFTKEAMAAETMKIYSEILDETASASNPEKL